MTEYYCCGWAEGCGYKCEQCGAENDWVNNHSFMNGEEGQSEEQRCPNCGQITLVQECTGCN